MNLRSISAWREKSWKPKTWSARGSPLCRKPVSTRTAETTRQDNRRRTKDKWALPTGLDWIKETEESNTGGQVCWRFARIPDTENIGKARRKGMSFPRSQESAHSRDQSWDSIRDRKSVV